MDKRQYQRGSGTSVTDMQRVDMARELLATAKAMQLQGLKRILDKAIEHPLIPKAARHHAETAYGIACMLEEELEWRTAELTQWMDLQGLTREVGDASTIPTVVRDAENHQVSVPARILVEPTNLRRKLDFEIAQVGMVAGQLVYDDMIAETTGPKKTLGGVFRDGKPAETIGEEEAQN